MPPRRRSLAVAWVLAFAAFFSLHPSTSIAARAGGDGATSSANPSVPRGLVVVLRPAELTETMRVVLARITGELTAASFQVRVDTLDPQKDPTQQIQAAVRDADAVAAFALGSGRDGLAIWIFERLGQRTTVQRVPVRRGGLTQDAKVLALKAVELIRASLADLWPAPDAAAAAPAPAISPAPVPPAPPPISPSAPPPSPPPAPPTASDDLSSTASPASPAPPSPLSPPPLAVTTSPAESPKNAEPAGPAWSAPRLAVGLGVAGLWDLQSSPQWLGSLHLEGRWSPRLTVQARIAGLGPSITIPAGLSSASLDRQRGSLGGAWIFWGGARADASVVAALGVEHVSASGSTNDPKLRSHVATAWVPIALAGLSARAHLATHWSISARAEAVWAWSKIDVAIADTRTDPLSRPGALVELGLQATF